VKDKSDPDRVFIDETMNCFIRGFCCFLFRITVNVARDSRENDIPTSKAPCSLMRITICCSQKLSTLFNTLAIDGTNGMNE
jgi:hypothetical protein